MTLLVPIQPMADMQRGAQTSALADGGQSTQEAGEAFCNVFNSVGRQAEARPADAPPADTAANSRTNWFTNRPTNSATDRSTQQPANQPTNWSTF